MTSVDRLPAGFWGLSCVSSVDTGSREDDFRWYLGRTVPNLGNQSPRNPGRVIFVMLNPSKARGIDVGDPTQRKCTGFTHRLGYGAYGIVNLFAYSTPYPNELFEFGYEHAIGRLNDEAILRVLDRAKAANWPVIAAWGAPSLPKNERLLVSRRVAHLYGWAKAMELPLYALAEGEGGYPRHPLMLGYEHASLKPWSQML